MKSIFFLFIFLIAVVASANNPGVSYQGRIFKPDGNPLEGSNVQFRMQVRSPGSENCLLYEEVQTINMAASSGIFSITLNDGSGTRLDTPTYQVDRIFANRDTMTLDATRCSVGTTYTPNSGDGRKFVVYFKDETMGAYEPLPIMSLNYSPQAMYALEAQKVDKFSINNILRTVDVSGNPVAAPALDPTQLTNLTNLLAGTSTQYATATQFNTVQTFAKSAPPTCGAGEFLKSDGTTLSCVTDSTGGAPAYSAITGATGINTIDNTNFAQTWNWSTATTQSPMTMNANALTTGSVMNVTTSSASLNSTNGLLNVSNTGASTSGILARFQSNSTGGSGLTVLTNGNVGIGTTSPISNLQVAKTQAGTTEISIQNRQTPAANNRTALVFKGYRDVQEDYPLAKIQVQAKGSYGGTLEAAQDGDMTFFTGGYANPTVGLFPRMTITAAGNVGIGTVTPLSPLDIQSEASVASSGYVNGVRVQQTITASANNDKLVGLYVNPTFNANGKTGTVNYGLVIPQGKVSIGTATPSWYGLEANVSSMYLHDGGTTYIYATGTGMTLGSSATPMAGLDVRFPQTASSGVAHGQSLTPTLTASANNDVLTGLYINPTFADASRTGVSHNGIIVASGNVGVGTTTPQAHIDIAIPTTDTTSNAELILSTHAGTYREPSIYLLGSRPNFTSKYGDTGVEGWRLASVSGSGGTGGYENDLTICNRNGTAAENCAIHIDSGTRNINLGGPNTSVHSGSKVNVQGNMTVGTAWSTYSTQQAAPANSLIVEGMIGIGIPSPGQKLEVNGGVRLNTATAQPACDSTTRGTFWVTQGGAGVKDAVEVCAKDAADSYAWRTLY